MNRARTTLVLSALGLVAMLPAQAQTFAFKTLANFNGAGVGAANPFGGLTLSGGTLWGTTESGGGGGGGTVFSLPTGGGVPLIRASFDGIGSNGSDPQAGLTLSGGTLYGTTYSGGSAANGTVFSVNAVTGALATLASFAGSNGANPSAGLTLGGTTLYGTTTGGGASGGGTVFSLPVSGGTPNVLASFAAANPNAGLVLSGGTLYGTTFYGGTNGSGSVFSVPVGGGTPTTLASFIGSNGANPYAGLTLVGSTFYGTTEFGGANGDGTVFSVPLAGGPLTTVASFTGAANGANPLAGLTAGVGGILYGTTQSGGTTNNGTVFSLNTATGALGTLVTFNTANGAIPLAGLTASDDGILYGTTSAGGDVAGDGTVFALTPAPEPSPWAVLALGGLGLAALTLRARRAPRP